MGTRIAKFSDNWLLRPWDMPDGIRLNGSHDRENGYPKPLVDFELANKSAKQQISELKMAFKTEPSAGFRERKLRHSNSKKRQTQNNKANISEQGKLF